MKKHLYFILCLALLSFSCEKEAPAPSADFSFNGDNASTLKMGTNDEVLLSNNSENGSSYLWRFGDGRLFEDKDVILSYPESGTYDVKLTVTNEEGTKSEITKKVIVLDRVLKKIVIDHIQWTTEDQEGLSFRWPRTPRADVFFQIQEFSNPHMEPLGIFPYSPVIYTSPVIKDVYHHTYEPIEIPVTQRIVIEKIKGSHLQHYAFLENLNKVYLYSLMARDKNGEVFNLYTNGGGGGNSIGIEKEDVKQNAYIINFSQLSVIKLVCEYE